MRPAQVKKAHAVKLGEHLPERFGGIRIFVKSGMVQASMKELARLW
jgi:hypothetical protein